MCDSSSVLSCSLCPCAVRVGLRDHGRVQRVGDGDGDELLCNLVLSCEDQLRVATATHSRTVWSCMIRVECDCGLDGDD